MVAPFRERSRSKTLMGSGERKSPFRGDDVDGGMPEGLIGDEDILRGWIPPDDRLWLHPSEIGRESREAGSRPRTQARQAFRPPGPVRRRSRRNCRTHCRRCSCGTCRHLLEPGRLDSGPSTTPTHLTRGASASTVSDPDNAFTERLRGCVDVRRDLRSGETRRTVDAQDRGRQRNMTRRSAPAWSCSSRARQLR